MKFRLMNEANEAGETGGVSEGATSASNAFSQSSSVSLGDNDDQAFRDAGLDPNKYGLGQDDEGEASKEDSQGSDKSQAAGQETDENAWLEKVNSIGAVHNETPIRVESIDQLKEFLQKGQDYTQKTQSLSEERKAWDSEKSGAEKELNSAIEEFNNAQKAHGQQLQELQQWTFALKELEANAPDIFEEVKRAYDGTVKQFSNPVLDQQLAAIRAELAETKKGLAQREDKLIVDSFDSEMTKLAPLEQSFKELGLTINKDEVKKKWAATGLPVEEVIGSMYGMKAMQAQASKSKVTQTQAKVSAKPTGGAVNARTGNKVKAIDPKLKGLAYASALLDRYSN
ncbi:MAG: hypothetical protein M3P98_03160 [bacterium]|nr:hypothetical protein [bacterium]